MLSGAVELGEGFSRPRLYKYLERTLRRCVEHLPPPIRDDHQDEESCHDGVGESVFAFL